MVCPVVLQGWKRLIGCRLFVFNWAALVVIVYGVYYTVLEPFAGASWFVCQGIPVIVVARLFFIHVPYAWAPAIGLHILGWVMQVSLMPVIVPIQSDVPDKQLWDYENPYFEIPCIPFVLVCMFAYPLQKALFWPADQCGACNAGIAEASTLGQFLPGEDGCGVALIPDSSLPSISLNEHEMPSHTVSFTQWCNCFGSARDNGIWMHALQWLQKLRPLIYRSGRLDIVQRWTSSHIQSCAVWWSEALFLCRAWSWQASLHGWKACLLWDTGPNSKLSWTEL